MKMMMTVSSMATDSSGCGSTPYQHHDNSITPCSFDASQFYCNNQNSLGGGCGGGGGSGGVGGGGNCDRTSTANSQNSMQNELGKSIREFIERYSLPRLVQIVPDINNSNGDDDDNADINNNNNNKQLLQQSMTSNCNENIPQPILLYRCFESFIKVKAKPFVGKKGKEKLSQTTVLYFPEGYPGLFSLVGEKGERQAVAYNSLLQLVREQVCTFLNAATFTAYINIAVNMPGGQYVRTSVHPGQVLRLRAVFQHSERKSKPSRSLSLGNSNSNQRDLANRYAQLLDHNNQELYAPLTTKGEFFEVHSSMKSKLCFPGMLDKIGPLAFDKDCLYRLSHLLHRIKLPIKVKLLAGNLPLGLPIDCTDTFLLEEKIQEPLVVTCSIPNLKIDRTSRHQIGCINFNSKLKIAKISLGYDSERRLFKSPRIQAAMFYCQNNVDNWYRELRLVPIIEKVLVESKTKDSNRNCSKTGPSTGGSLGNCYCSITETAAAAAPAAKPSKKWFRNFKLSKSDTSASSSGGCDGGKEPGTKLNNIGKKIEEKFLKKNTNPVKKSASFMFTPQRLDLDEIPIESIVVGNRKRTERRNAASRMVSKSHSMEDNLSKDFSTDSTQKNCNESIYCNIIEINQEKNHPDLIPYDSDSTPPKKDPKLDLFISSKLKNEFHVKTKLVPKRKQHSYFVHASNYPVCDFENCERPDEVPYLQVKDNIRVHEENPYAEIK